MTQDIDDMVLILERMSAMIRDAKDEDTERAAIGALAGMQDALHDMDVIHSYLNRRSRP